MSKKKTRQPSNASLRHEVIQARRALESAKSEIASLSETLKQSQTDLNTLERKNTELDRALTTVTNDFAVASNKVKSLENKNNELSSLFNTAKYSNDVAIKELARYKKMYAAVLESSSHLI